METVSFMIKEKKREAIIDELKLSNNIYVRDVNVKKASYLQRFLKFADDQKDYKFGWVGISLSAHGCVLAPLTIFCILFSGNLLALWIPCILGFVLIEIVNLAAMPTKITIPFFVASVILDFIIMAISLIIILTH